MTSEKTHRPGEGHDVHFAALIERERDSANRIRVPSQLRDPHPLIQRTQEALEAAKPDDYGLLRPFGPTASESADVALAPGSIRRGLGLMNALYRALESRGHRVEAVEQPHDQEATTSRVRCVVLGEEFRVRLREKAHRVPVEDRPERARRVHLREHRYEPTGILELSIPESYGRGLAAWKDSAKSKVEDFLNKVVIAMLEAVEPRRESQERAARARQDSLRAEAERSERERLRRLETIRVAGLEGLAERWEKARRLRGFVAAAREEALRRYGSGDEVPDVARWLAWADAYVRSIDPLRAEEEFPSMASPGDPPSAREEGSRSQHQCPRCGATNGWSGLVCSHCFYGLTRR